MPYRIDAPIAPPAATHIKDTMDGIGTELAFWFRGLYRKMAQQNGTTMNRLLIYIILLVIGQPVLAEKLYRWVEPDGSITFSPTPPPAGIDYKAVNAAHNNAAKADLPELDQQPTQLATPETDQQPTQLATPETDQKPSILATSEHDLEAHKSLYNSTQIVAPTPAIERQKLSYAPDIGPTSKTTLPIAAAETASSQPAVSPINSVAASKKRRHCQDLHKRVLSLERRLRTPLKPLDMDNTVVAMARYQRSYDQHCVD